jgi:high frequency lysogenization protein
VSDARTLREQTLAFMGIAQAATLVDDIANGRPVSVDGEQAIVAAIFVTDPESVDEVIGNVGNYTSGLATARALLSTPDQRVVEAMKYTMAIIDISRRLRKNRPLTARLGELIGELAPSWQTLSPDELFQQASAVYQSTISTLDRRVHVRGSGELLQQADVANRIRTLLLAGVRFAWLWQQLGGRRWHLLMRRSTMRKTLDDLNRSPLH